MACRSLWVLDVDEEFVADSMVSDDADDCGWWKNFSVTLWLTQGIAERQRLRGEALDGCRLTETTKQRATVMAAVSDQYGSMGARVDQVSAVDERT